MIIYVKKGVTYANILCTYTKKTSSYFYTSSEYAGPEIGGKMMTWKINRLMAVWSFGFITT